MNKTIFEQVKKENIMQRVETCLASASICLRGKTSDDIQLAIDDLQKSIELLRVIRDDRWNKENPSDNQ